MWISTESYPEAPNTNGSFTEAAFASVIFWGLFSAIQKLDHKSINPCQWPLFAVRLLATNRNKLTLTQTLTIMIYKSWGGQLDVSKPLTNWHCWKPGIRRTTHLHLHTHMHTKTHHRALLPVTMNSYKVYKKNCWFKAAVINVFILTMNRMTFLSGVGWSKIKGG